MVNASEIINKKNINNDVKNIFVKKVSSKIDLVRVAFHLNEIDSTIQIAKILQRLDIKLV